MKREDAVGSISSDKVIVRGDTLRVVSIFYVPLAGVLLLLLLALQTFTAIAPPDRLQFQAGIVMVLVAFPLVLYLGSTHRVEVDDRGIVMVTGVSKLTFIPWRSFVEPNVPFTGVAMRLQYDGGRSGEMRSFSVSKEQAVAILTHRSCPHRKLSAEVRKSLGLPTQ